MKNVGEVYLRLYGDDFEPNDVSAFLGIEATSALRKGEHRSDIPLPKVSSWEFSSGRFEDEVIDVYDLSENLVAQLAPFASKIAEARKVFHLDCVFQVVLWIDRDESASTPAIGFDSTVVAFLHEVGATVDVDTYLH